MKKANIKESAIVAISRLYLSLSDFFLKGKITMRDVEKTIGNFIDKSKISYISSIDEDGFPNTKAMLAPRDRDGIKAIYFSTNTSSMRVSQYRKNTTKIWICPIIILPIYQNNLIPTCLPACNFYTAFRNAELL